MVHAKEVNFQILPRAQTSLEVDQITKKQHIWTLKFLNFLPSVRGRQQISIESFMDLELLEPINSLQSLESINWNFTSPCNVLKEIGFSFPIEFIQYFPEPHDVNIIFLVVVVIRVHSQVAHYQ